ncbi:M4 family metallopeptidase [Nocardia sp. CDC159]|uniref:Neutral metalloproteinase n=1 Tax=Nocardia pulmonis TaxID=2951408 RepID=A0A9X2EA25_9NOCA|nr:MULTISPECIES: M4 family metallopeptidase [Nocardia]MCM6776539.1 M4 family metallopeptidase [Nocardia pulmonis]MCM6788963.1 M4 family metallopeptidase [Nocardia sp. CDC159]
MATTIFASTTGAYGQPPTPTPGSDLTTVPKEVLKDPEGTIRQVVPQQPVPVPSGTPREAPSAAQAHAPGVAKTFTGAPVGALVVDQVLPVGEGSTVRLRQEIDSVPVFGASVSQLLAKDGSLVSATGSLTQQSQGRFTTTTATQAVSATAVKAVAEQTKTPADKLATGAVKAYWYDAKLASAPDGKSVAVPAFKVTVTGDGKDKNKPSEFIVFVDANDNAKVLDSWDAAAHLNRVVCDAANKRVDLNSPVDPTECGTANGFKATRVEGRGPVGIADVDNVFGYFGNTEGFYAKNTQLPGNLTSYIGKDTGDGHGTALRGTVRICDVSECPYANAFWYNGHMAYGSGVTTEDITGHELTHGVTERVNGLQYRYESGAINESMSDIFGEFVFLADTANPCNTAANRWKLGACSSLGVIRDMKNPKAYRQPDTYKGTYWYTGSGDNGGVHTNSGVGNKAAQLLVDGGSHNGVNVTAIGLEKTAALYWTTQTLLTSNATYRTLGSALNNACKANVQNKVKGTTAADCTQVANAVKAVKMPTLNVAS